MKKLSIHFLVLSGFFLLTGCEKKEGIEQVFCYECTKLSKLKLTIPAIITVNI